MAVKYKNISIRFYDNQPDIIQQFKTMLKKIDTIYIPDKPNKEILNTTPQNFTREFLKKYPNNNFAKYLLSFRNNERSINIGFSLYNAKDLLKWSFSTIHTKVAIFDWDGTLSVAEGVILPSNPIDTLKFHKMGINYRDIAIYYCGSEKRFLWLKYMFEILHKNKVEIFILTNNPMAAKNMNIIKLAGLGFLSRFNFYNVIKQIIPHFQEDNLLCGYETNGIKPQTFMNVPYLNKLYKKMDKDV
jgi:hypothetical protein